MDLATKDIIFIFIVFFSVFVLSFFICDVMNNPKRYESNLFQFAVSFVLLGIVGLNGCICYYLCNPITTITEEIVFSDYLATSYLKKLVIQELS